MYQTIVLFLYWIRNTMPLVTSIHCLQWVQWHTLTHSRVCLFTGPSEQQRNVHKQQPVFDIERPGAAWGVLRRYSPVWHIGRGECCRKGRSTEILYLTSFWLLTLIISTMKRWVVGVKADGREKVSAFRILGRALN